MSGVCPCCGGDISPLDLIVDRTSGRIAYGNADARLTGQEMRLFSALFDAYPRVISRYDLLTAAAFDPENEPDVKIVDVLVCKIRPKIDPLGLVITTSWGVGYQLEPSEATKAALLRERRFRETRSRRTVAESGDLAAIAMLRAQGLPVTAIAPRLRLTFAAVTAAIDVIEADKRPTIGRFAGHEARP